jgi:DNA modification methylase
MVAVFRGVRRVLRDDGTCWLNYGDTYANTGACGGASLRRRRAYRGTDKDKQDQMKRTRDDYGGIKAGNLVGVPWRVALALQADGWVLRQDVVWHKPAPMPESVRNRCTKAHEYVFLLTKGARYFYDAEAIKEKAGGYKTGGAMNYRTTDDGDGREFQSQDRETEYQSSNKRSVWTVSSKGYEGAHFATFPPKLIEPMILAGTSARGACAKCGAPWRRVVEERALRRDRPNEYVKRTGEDGTGNSCANTVAGVDVRTVGWEPTCRCFGRFEKRTGPANGSPAIAIPGHSGNSRLAGYADMNDLTETVEKSVTVYVSDLPLDRHPVVPCTVLDPFVGSGTTCAVAVQAGRRGWGIDLSEKYLMDNAVVRVKGALLARPNLTYLVPRGVAAAPRTSGTNLLRPGPRGGGG